MTGHAVWTGEGMGCATLIEPPKVQAQTPAAVASATPECLTQVDGGAHGAATAGVHGAGVWTPCAAAVAATTAGFVTLLHMPNGAMFVPMANCVIVAAGSPFTAGAPGKALAMKGTGAVPMLHWSGVVLTRNSGIASTLMYRATYEAELVEEAQARNWNWAT